MRTKNKPAKLWEVTRTFKLSVKVMATSRAQAISQAEELGTQDMTTEEKKPTAKEVLAYSYPRSTRRQKNENC